jgi:signal transduction histidine kinase
VPGCLTVTLDWIGLTLLAVMAVVLAVFHALRARASRRELEAAVELASQRERERDLAQAELVQRFQQERELEREKVQFQAQLSEYEKYAALAQLALGAAHEINNPLLGILSHLELELKNAQSEEAKIEIEQCIEGAQRISATLQGLLNYARPAPPQLAKINLQRLVGSTLQFLRHQPMFHGLIVENKIPPYLPTISADSNQLTQVITNLLLNAVQASEEGGRISVSAERVGFENKVELSISDTGRGIPPDVLPHVFEPFFTTKRGKGTGLGLAICQSYLRSHGGDIKIESTVGKGTTVKLILPIREEEAANAAQVEEVIR